jgi:hypothetical protein
MVSEIMWPLPARPRLASPKDSRQQDFGFHSAAGPARATSETQFQDIYALLLPQPTERVLVNFHCPRLPSFSRTRLSLRRRKLPPSHNAGRSVQVRSACSVPGMLPDFVKPSEPDAGSPPVKHLSQPNAYPPPLTARPSQIIISIAVTPGESNPTGRRAAWRVESDRTPRRLASRIRPAAGPPGESNPTGRRAAWRDESDRTPRRRASRIRPTAVPPGKPQASRHRSWPP